MIAMDVPKLWPGRLAARLGKSSHLVSTLAGAEGTRELLAFAEAIGLRASWLQHAGTWREHFDVFGSRIEQAKHAGARVLEREAFVAILRTKRGDHG